jgi:hypothetical protein
MLQHFAANPAFLKVGMELGKNLILGFLALQGLQNLVYR